jgi:hypothetical protein
LYFTEALLPFAKMMVKPCAPVVTPLLTVTTTVSDLPVSRVTLAVIPATLLITLGRPKKPEPRIVTVVLLPTHTAPATRVALGPGTTNVTVVAGLEIARLVMEAAFVAVTMHVPTLVTVNELADTTQPVAVPFVTLKVIAPVPDPPLVVSVSGLPTVPDSDVRVRTVWAPWLSTALLVTVVSVLDVSLAMRVHEPRVSMTRALNVTTPALAVAVVVPARVHVDVIVMESVAPVPEDTVFP